MKTLNVKLDDWTHKQLKALVALKETTIAKIIRIFVEREIKDNQEECELCRQYGHEPNEETRKALEEEHLSEPISGEEFLKKMDEEYGEK